MLFSGGGLLEECLDDDVAAEVAAAADNPRRHSLETAHTTLLE